MGTLTFLALAIAWGVVQLTFGKWLYKQADLFHHGFRRAGLVGAGQVVLILVLSVLTYRYAVYHSGAVQGGAGSGQLGTRMAWGFGSFFALLAITVVLFAGSYAVYGSSYAQPSGFADAVTQISRPTGSRTLCQALSPQHPPSSCVVMKTSSAALGDASALYLALM